MILGILIGDAFFIFFEVRIWYPRVSAAMQNYFFYSLTGYMMFDNMALNTIFDYN